MLREGATVYRLSACGATASRPCGRYATGGRVKIYTVWYYSVGGGFVVSAEKLQLIGKTNRRENGAATPYPLTSAREMFDMAERGGLSIAEMKRANEELRMPRVELNAGLDALWTAMSGCIDRGLS